MFAVGLKKLTFTISTMFIFPVHFFFDRRFFSFVILDFPCRLKKTKIALEGATADED